MNLLFSMSLAGSLALILYLAVRLAARRYLSANWHYRLLKISLLFFLLPYQHFKYRYVAIWRFLFPGQQQNTEPGLYIPTGINGIVLVDSDGQLHFENQTVILTILGIWGVLAIVFLLYHLIKYVYCMRDLQQITKLPVALPDEYRRSKRCARTEVSLFANQYITTPFTVGLLSPCIILPASLVNKKECEMIISHEMTHVRNCDNLIKFLWLLAMLMHWYNPLIYVLYWEICRISEQVCDASVIQDMPEQERDQYKLLLVELGKEKPHTDTLLSSPFNGSFRMMKERIMIMNKTTISSKRVHIVSSLVMAVLILALSPISVLAYAPAPTYEYQDEEFILGDEILSTVPDKSDFQDKYDPFQQFGAGHGILITADGQLYIIDDADPQIERISCFHDWQDGTLVTHDKHDDGSCTVYMYDCQYCTICHSHRNITLIKTVTYVICPH